MMVQQLVKIRIWHWNPEKNLDLNLANEPQIQNTGYAKKLLMDDLMTLNKSMLSL